MMGGKGACPNAKCWGGSPFAGNKMLNAGVGPAFHGAGGVYNDGESEIRAPRTLALLPLALTLFHLSSLTYYHKLKVYIAHSILQSHLVTIVFVVRCEGCDIPVLWLLFISSMAV